MRIMGSLATAAVILAAALPAWASDIVSDTQNAITRARQVMMSTPKDAIPIGKKLEAEAAAMSPGPGRDLAMSRAHWIVGEATNRAGDPKGALPLIESAMTLARRAGNMNAEADAILSRGSVKHDMAQTADALRDYLAAARIFRTARETRSLAVALQCLGILYNQAGDTAKARRYFIEAGTVHRGEPRMDLSLESGLAGIAMTEGRHAEARTHYLKAVGITIGMRDDALEGRIRTSLARNLSLLGDNRGAWEQIGTAMAAYRRAGRAPDRDLRAVRAAIAWQMGSKMEALREIDALRPFGREERVLMAARDIYRAAGRHRDAYDAFSALQIERDKMAQLAVSQNAALMSARFDYAGQSLRIARLNADRMRRQYADEVASAARSRNMVLIGGIGTYVLICLLVFGVISYKRGRDSERRSNEELGRANEALAEALQEIKDRSESERQALMLSEQDTLTGLPNRRHLHRRLEAEFAGGRDAEGGCAVILLDLDRFKAVNDVCGHHAGDAVLLEVARRLQEVCEGREAHTLRLGGDEFLIAITGHEDARACEEIAAAAVETLRAPFEIEERRHQLGASAGIARYPQDGSTVEEIMRAADVAMYEAKRSGRNTHRFYDGELDRRVKERAMLESDLRVAVREKRIEAWFQPITCLRTGRVASYEALARWDHARCGMVPPDVFIPIAEEAGLIEEITTSILQQACRAAAAWEDDITVAVNMSPVMLRDDWIIAKTFSILQQERLRPERLVIEITENAVIDDLDFAREAIAAFRDAGIKVALDDFGRGYSSLAMLKELDFDHLKLDATFVRSIEDGEGLEIMKAVASLAKAMGMTATAEGVEREAEARVLVDMGFDYAQGYLYGRVVPTPAAANTTREAA